MFLVVVGVDDWLVPHYFERLVPPWIPAARAAVLLSGAAEVVLGVGLAVEATRVPAAAATTALFAVYVVTHVDALRRSRRPGAATGWWLDRTPAATLRVVVNAAYVAWAAGVAVGAGG